MKTHRCSRCDINWTLTPSFAELCPVCGFHTFTTTDRPLTIDEARRFQLDVAKARETRDAFEAYLAAHVSPTCACGEPNTLVDELYAVCERCDRADPSLTLDAMPGWDEPLLPEPRQPSDDTAS